MTSSNQTRLPVELVLLILEQAYYDARGFPDRATLRASALVCMEWSSPAQRLLFHELTVPAHARPARRKAFRTTLFSPSERARNLAVHVRRVHITIEGPSDEDDLVDLVHHCSQLYELVLRASGVHALQEPTLQALGDAAVIGRAGPPRALFLRECGVQSPILYQLLTAWPTIRFLRLGSEIAAPAPRTMLAKARLYELVLYRTPSLGALSWMLSGSKGTLRIFECHAVPSGKYDEILDDHTEHLLSLRLRQTPRARTFIRKCVNLQEIAFIQLSTFLPLGEFPSTVEHLTIRHIPAVSTAIPMSIISAIDKLPRLRLVSCDASAQENEDYPVLEEKCREKGVVLDHNVVPIQQWEDPIPMFGYPRGRSIANFRYMTSGYCPE